MEVIDLDELQRLHEAATPGTWEAREHLVLLPLWNRKYPDGQLRICPSLTYEHQSVEKPNAALIAAARNALPALLRLARRARRLEEAVRAAEGFISGAMPYYAADRKQAIERVVPLLRAALAEGEG